jgi:hypothetical protein
LLTLSLNSRTILGRDVSDAIDSRSGLKIGVSPTPEVLPSLQASTFVSELRIRLTSEWGKPLSAINSRYWSLRCRVTGAWAPRESGSTENDSSDLVFEV